MHRPNSSCAANAPRAAWASADWARPVGACVPTSMPQRAGPRDLLHPARSGRTDHCLATRCRSSSRVSPRRRGPLRHVRWACICQAPKILTRTIGARWSRMSEPPAASAIGPDPKGSRAGLRSSRFSVFSPLLLSSFSCSFELPGMGVMSRSSGLSSRLCSAPLNKIPLFSCPDEAPELSSSSPYAPSPKD